MTAALPHGGLYRRSTVPLASALHAWLQPSEMLDEIDAEELAAERRARRADLRFCFDCRCALALCPCGDGGEDEGEQE